jgi:hypothetical protein
MADTDPQGPRHGGRRRTALLWVAALSGLLGLTCLGFARVALDAGGDTLGLPEKAGGA